MQGKKSWAPAIKDYRLALLRDHSKDTFCLKHESGIRGGLKEGGRETAGRRASMVRSLPGDPLTPLSFHRLFVDNRDKPETQGESEGSRGG